MIARLFFSSSLQGPEHARGPTRHGQIEADEHEDRDDEDHEHKPERHDAALRAEA